MPTAAFAATVDLSKPGNATLTNFVNNFINVLNSVVPLAAFFGFFVFITGVLKYVNAGGDSERLTSAKQFIIYGLIGLLVIFSYWGVAKLLSNTSLLVGA